MKKKFNLTIIVSILILAFMAVMGQHYFDRMEAPILAMKQMNLEGAIGEDIYILNKSYNISFWVITLSQIASIIILVGVIYYNNEQSKELEQHEGIVNAAEEQLELHKKELEDAYALLEKAKKASERNSIFLEIIQKADSLEKLSFELINNLAKQLNASQAAFFITEKRESQDFVKLIASYAYHIPESKEVIFEFGEGLVGQVASDATTLNLKELPAGHLEIISGLGSTQNANLIIVPIISDGMVIGVFEIASFEEFTDDDVLFVEGISQNTSTKLSVFIA